jgi:hypothetical protein
MNTELVTFEIAVEFFHRFVAEFAKLAKKAAKLKVIAPTYEVIEEKVIPASINGTTGEVVKPARVLKVIKVSGQAPKIGGWTFVAVLQHEEKGNIVRRVPGTESIKVEKDLRAVDPFCNHCNTERRRKDTYVVAHEDGRQLQIGRNCLKDFTGHDSPEAIARWAELLFAFESTVDETFDEGHEGGFGGGRDYGWSLQIFLCTVAAAIREGGWLSRGKARELTEKYSRTYAATADITTGYLFARTAEQRRNFISEITPVDDERAAAAITYAKAHFEAAEDAGRELDDYEHNLRLVVEGNSVTGRSAGIAASIIPFVERLQGKEIERRRAAKSEFQGTVGKRDFFMVQVVRVIDLHSEMFGTSHLHLMSDEAGNRFTWKTSSYCLQTGGIYRVLGSVKEHKIYSRSDVESSDPGIKQTVLTRCSADLLIKEDADLAEDATLWTTAAAKRIELEAELAAKTKAAKDEAKAAKKAAKAAAKAV